MHTKLIATALVGLLVGTAGADEFYLKHDRTGKVFGPFQTDAGSRVTIGSTTFTVVQENSGGSVAEKTLSKVMLPEVLFRGAALADSVKLLDLQTKQLAPKGEVVNFVVVQPKRESQQKTSDPFASPPRARTKREPRVNLELRDVSVLAALKMVMEQTGATYKISGNTVTVYPKN